MWTCVTQHSDGLCSSWESLTVNLQHHWDYDNTTRATSKLRPDPPWDRRSACKMICRFDLEVARETPSDLDEWNASLEFRMVREFQIDGIVMHTTLSCSSFTIGQIFLQNMIN